MCAPSHTHTYKKRSYQLVSGVHGRNSTEYKRDGMDAENRGDSNVYFNFKKLS